MREYKKIAIKIIKKLNYIIPIILVTIASYGYLLIHNTVNIDVLSGDKYFNGEYLIAQKRIAGPILQKVFGIFDFYPFLADFIAVILFIIASVLFCTLFHVTSKGKIKTIAYTIFSCLFISYPLMMQFFPYIPMGISIGLGYCLVAISILSFESFLRSQKCLYAIISIGTLWCSISLYESFATVYIMVVLSILLIEILFLNKKISEIIFKGLKFILPLLIAILLNIIVSNLILALGNIKIISNAQKEILYFAIGIKSTIKNLIETVTIDYIISAFGYLPFTILLMSSIISFVIAIIFSIKKKDVSIFLIIIGMNITLLLLSIMQGMAAAYRTCQQFPIFVGVIFMVLTQLVLSTKLNKNIKNIFLFFIFLIILYQVKDLYYWEYLNTVRYEKEKQDVIAIGNDIVKNYNYKEKPVVFCGQYNLTQKVKEQITIKKDSLYYKILKYYNKNFTDKRIKDLNNYVYTQTSIQSYIDWSITAFAQNGEPINEELTKFFYLLGYDIKQNDLDIESYIELIRENVNLFKDKDKTSIFETDKYIIVYFS